MSSVRWLRQATWVIDPISGNDRNDGHNDAHAIQHWEELWRRLGPRAYIHDINMTVSVKSSAVAGDYARFDMILGKNANLAVTGVKSTAGNPSGTLTGFTPRNRTVGAEAMPIIADTALSAAGFSTAVGKLVKITGGARSGTGFFVAKDTGTKTARITTPVTIDDPTTLSPTRQTPAIADPYQVYTLPVLYNGGLNFVAGDYNGIVASQNIVRFDSVDLNTSFASTSTNSNALSLFFGDCILSGSFYSIGTDFLTCTNTWFNAAGAASAFSVSLCPYVAVMAGGASATFYMATSQVYMDFDFLIQGAAHGANVSDGAVLFLANAAMFDNTTFGSGGLTAFAGAVIYAGPQFESDGLFWGTNNSTTGPGLRVDAGGILSYSAGSLPQINKGLGGTREVKIGGQNFLWSEVAQTTGITANGASLVLDTF